uniref:Disease resistance protein RPM1 n=1 Tax=Anthurium amnicola TaxID=1678845 RepID=A0A1D1ZFV8_9ARAE
MAEALFFFLIQKITSVLGEEALKQASSLFAQEVTLLTQVRSRMSQIKSEFEVIKAFLSYIGMRKDNNLVLEAWVKQVRDVAFEVEDILDKYTYLLADQHRRSSRSFIIKTFHHSSNFWAWNEIATQLEEILNRLHHLRDMKDRYGIKTVEGESSNSTDERDQNLAQSSHFLDDDEIVGIKTNKKLLVQWLTDKEPKRTIISVCGMVGLGKTTLVSKVYRSKIIKVHFDCHAWISVSQTYLVDDLLRRIVGEFFKDKEGGIPQHIDTMSRTGIVEILHDYLQNKRYVIILDDVWSTDVWTALRDLIVGNNCASRVVVTTRNQKVASLAAKNRVMKLEPLSSEEAWSLFCRKAFWKDRERKCPPVLENQAKEIMNKCECLPLAIVAVGNLLSLRHKKELEWKKVLDDINWELNNSPELDLMKRIFALSLKDLPEYLKNCFLYCGIFPEDYLIKRKKLIRLWIAEGFIKERRRRTMEEVAEDNLNELIHRCMLQIVERNDFGRVRACKMNAIMRELTLSISEKEDFYVVCENSETSSLGEARRLSVHRCGNTIQLSERNMLHLRSLILFDAIIFPKFRFKLLRVLDMQGAPIESLPHEVFDMFNLYYLGLRNTRIRKISKSIKRLINLQTLDLAYTKVKKLPDGVAELKSLRHLFVHTIVDQTHKSFNYFCGFPAPKGICDLKDLHTLQGVEASKEMIRHLKKMAQLRSFRIMKVRGIHCMELSAAIEKMDRLHKLDIWASEEREALDLGDMSISSSHLQKLTLRAQLKHKVLPSWFCSLNNLTWLRLGWTGLQGDPLPIISKLPSLVFLLLLKAYDGHKLCFQEGWFPKLKDLRLLDMDHLQHVEIEKGALTKLRQLNLVRCGELEEVPNGIVEHLTKLEMLFLEEMPEEFVRSLRSKIHGKLEESVITLRSKTQEDCTRILHIPPVITHIFQTDGRWYRESLRDPSLFDSLNQDEYIAMLREEMDLKEER